jgi:hypothetical protein
LFWWCKAEEISNIESNCWFVCIECV